MNGGGAVVLAPGARTLVQDLGRRGHAHLGVPRSGAADPWALRLANRLVGNPDGAAGLEIAAHGPDLLFDCDTTIALAGAGADATLDGAPMPAGHTVAVRAGQVLRIGPVHTGLTAYLAVGGGLGGDPVLGSRSTCTLSGLGPSPLAAGDRLELARPALPSRWLAALPNERAAGTCRVMPGPHAGLLGSQALDALAAGPWQVAAASNRVGTRLEGPALPGSAGQLPSLGMAAGAVQVPPSGHPVVLGPDHGTTGGYPVLAVVITADLGVLAQARAGAPLRFVVVGPEQSRQAAVDAEAALDRAVVSLDALHRH